MTRKRPRRSRNSRTSMRRTPTWSATARRILRKFTSVMGKFWLKSTKPRRRSGMYYKRKGLKYLRHLTRRLMRWRNRSGEKKKRRKITSMITSRRKRNSMNTWIPWLRLLRRSTMTTEYLWRNMGSSKYSFWVKRTTESFYLSNLSTRRKRVLGSESSMRGPRSKLIRSKKLTWQMKLHRS